MGNQIRYQIDVDQMGKCQNTIETISDIFGVYPLD